MRERSPNYPHISLGEAVKGAQALFKQESRTTVPQEVAVRAWGYTTLNGAARRRIGALRQYGLVETDRIGNIRVSRRGITLSMRSSDSPEYLGVVKEAALSPAIFREMYDAKPGASDEALKHYLVMEQKFSPDGAKHVVEAYRSTLEFANLGDSGYTQQVEEEYDMEQTDSGDDNPARRGVASESINAKPLGQYTWPLSSGVTVEVTFRGSKVTRRELQLLQQYLTLVEMALDDSTETHAQESPPSPLNVVNNQR